MYIVNHYGANVCNTGNTSSFKSLVVRQERIWLVSDVCCLMPELPYGL